MKIRDKPINWNNLLAVFGFCFFIYFVVIFSHKYYHLNYYGAIAKCTIDSIYFDQRYQRKVKYTFTVNGNTYEGTGWYHESIEPEVGQFYDVRYSTEDPLINEIIYPKN